MDLMRQLNRENGQTFVIVTHDPEIGAQCDRVITIRDGLCENCEVEDVEPAPVAELSVPEAVYQN
jgi:ABC-type lipoprotein export system ATPase subunit